MFWAASAGRARKAKSAAATQRASMSRAWAAKGPNPVLRCRRTGKEPGIDDDVVRIERHLEGARADALVGQVGVVRNSKVRYRQVPESGESATPPPQRKVPRARLR